jgi:SSS family solute:Na+ symporter
MKLTLADWLVVAAYFLINLIIGLYYRKKGSASTDDFFVSGREVSWWLAGTSMVATTFAADTPLAVTGLVIKQGIAGNWLWWSLLLNGMMTVFFYARLWRRAEIITDVELVELRYAGKPAAFLRGFRALYFGIFMNCLVLGWVNLAMEKILGTSLNMPRFWTVVICMFVTALYTSISGLWGVLWTDVVQFILKMTMVVVLAVYAVHATGGMVVMKTKLTALDAARRAAEGGTGSIMSFIPDLHSPWMPILAFCVYLGVNWWANWYPGAEPGGGGFVAQRMFSAKDEKNSLGATLFFTITHYALRPWPWIITALAAAVLYPQLSVPGADPETGYIKVWVDYLPGALRGFMLAAFAAAYMSTIATQLNWGSSYVVNDFYRRFIAKDRSEPHYVAVSRISTMGLMVLGAAVSYLLVSVSGTWTLLMGIGAGTGAVYLLRWYWWRINAWSEIVAMVVAALMQVLLRTVIHIPGPESMVFAKSILLTVTVTTLAWVIVTYCTKPEPESKLLAFYRRVRPDVYGWKRIAAQAPEVAASREAPHNLVDWVLGCIMVYMALFGIGKVVLGYTRLGLTFLVIAGISAYAIFLHFSRRGWETLSGKE